MKCSIRNAPMGTMPEANAAGAKGKKSLGPHAAELPLSERERYWIQQNWPRKPRSQLLMIAECISKHFIIKFAKSASQGNCKLTLNFTANAPSSRATDLASRQGFQSSSKR